VSRTVPARTIRARRTPPAGSSTLPLTRSCTCDARVLNRTPCPGQAKHGKMIFRASRVPTGRNRHHRSVPRRPAPARRHARAGTLLTGVPSGGAPAPAASGSPLPTRAKSSCRRWPRVNTVGVCADEPHSQRRAGHRAGPAACLASWARPSRRCISCRHR
jgi:hypothetical protein